MKPEFWKDRWARGETGWHQDEVEPGLVAHLGGLAPTRVLVPLCGKSLDLAWLSSQGHEVIGIELSEIAVRSFFAEHAMPVTESRRGAFTAFSSGTVTILLGDFFDLRPEDLGGTIGALYDRAALIALPEEMRARYARKITELVSVVARPGFVHLQLALERTPHDENGPPHSVREVEVRRLYSGSCDIEFLGRELVGESNGVRVDECTYRLTPRAQGASSHGSSP